MVPRISMGLRLFFVSFALASLSFAQVEIKLIFKGLISDTSKNPTSGTSVYLLQDNQTFATALSVKNGTFILVGSVYKKTPVIVQFSKPGFLTRNLYYDISTLALSKKIESVTVMLAEKLMVQMVRVNPIFQFSVGANDYAEKFKWDESQLKPIPDLAHKTAYNDSLKNRIWQEEGKLKLEKYKSKSRELEQVQNYKLALDYLDTAMAAQTNYKLVDTSLTRKKSLLQKAFSAQQLAQQKQKSIDSLFHIGDSLLALLKWQDAEKIYNSVSQYDPKSDKLKTKLASIAAIRKEEDELKKELEACRTNRVECTRLAANKKYNEAIVTISKSNSLPRISQAIKYGVSVTLDSLKLLIKEQNLDGEVAKLMKVAQTTKGDNSAMKNALESIISLIGNYQTTAKQVAAYGTLDQVITGYVQAEIQRGYELQSNQDYDKAIDVYVRLKDVLAFTHDLNLKQNKVSDIDQKVEAAKKAKEQEILNVSEAMKKVKNMMDSLTFDAQYGPNYQPKIALGIIKTLLANSPLKQKATTPEVVAIKTRLMKLEPYFLTNQPTLKNISLKDSTKALQAANELLTKAGVAETGMLELSYIKLKIDSIQANMKIASSANSANNTVRSTIISAPPGAKLFTGNPTALQASLSSSSDRKALRVKNAINNLKYSADEANYRADVQHEEAVRANRHFLEEQNTSLSRANENEADRAKKGELTGRALASNTQAAIAQENAENQAMIQRSQDQQDKLRNRHDSLMTNQLDNHSSAREATRDFVDSMVVSRSQQDIDAAQQNKRLDEAQRKVISQNQMANHVSDRAAYEQSKHTQRRQEERRNFIPLETFAPNYLKNDSGECFIWNSMTELVYTYEDAFGFEIGKLVRRVVVNANGYGMVYEQMVDENGISSFTMNQQPITEFVWLHDSEGIPFISEGGPITPPMCP